VLHFVKTLKILGLGEKTLERLGVDSVPYVYQMSKQYMTDVLGETTGEKLYDRIQASKQVPLSRFITALAIPLVGKSVGEKIEESISEGFWELTEEICKKAGVGAKASLNLCYWIKENKLYKDLPVDLTYGDNKIRLTKEVTYNVVITGKLNDFSSREQAKQYLTPLGVKVLSGVSSKVDFLVCDKISNSSSCTKAQKLNIPIISMSELTTKLS
jgi:DNA ligase (NAD+)